MRDKTVLLIGSVNQSPFIQSDVDILKGKCNLLISNIDASLNKSFRYRCKQYYDLLSITIFDIIPKIKKSDVVYIWFADLHAFIPLLICKLLKKECVISIGGYEVSNMPEIHYGMMQRPLSIRARICKWIIQNADMCVTPSITYYNKTQKFNDRVLYAPNCITSDITQSDICDRKNIVLMVGNATKSDYLLKGIPEYNEAAKNIDAHFYLIGKYDEEIKQKYNNIFYLGPMHHNNVMQWMRLSRTYCQLSKTESFGFSVLEAMMNGCVPVVTDIDDMYYIVQDMGLVTNNNIDSIITNIKSSLQMSLNIHNKIYSYAYQRNEKFQIMRSYMFNFISR